MKRKVLLWCLAWALSISALHVHLNVGWARLAASVHLLSGARRGEMTVGFLPVT